MFYYKNVQKTFFTWDTMQKYFIRMSQLSHWTYLHLKNCCLSDIQIWLSILFFSPGKCIPALFQSSGISLDYSWGCPNFPTLGSEDQLLHWKRNFCFELRKYEDFHDDLVMLFSNIFSGLSLLTICCELNLKSLFLISICLLK